MLHLYENRMSLGRILKERAARPAKSVLCAAWPDDPVAHGCAARKRWGKVRALLMGEPGGWIRPRLLIGLGAVLLVAAGAGLWYHGASRNGLLCDAAKAGSPADCRRLIAQGANAGCGCSQEEGRTPLHLAADLGRDDVCLVLLEAGANVNARSDYGETSLQAAAELGDTALCEMLLAHGASANAVDDKGETALHEAAKYGHEEACGVLLKGGAWAGATDRRGRTPLHLAALRGDVAVCSMLLKAGAVAGCKDRDGNRPLDLALGAEKRQVIDLLGKP